MDSSAAAANPCHDNRGGLLFSISCSCYREEVVSKGVAFWQTFRPPNVGWFEIV